MLVGYMPERKDERFVCADPMLGKQAERAEVIGADGCGRREGATRTTGICFQTAQGHAEPGAGQVAASGRTLTSHMEEPKPNISASTPRKCASS